MARYHGSVECYTDKKMLQSCHGVKLVTHWEISSVLRWYGSVLKLEKNARTRFSRSKDRRNEVGNIFQPHYRLPSSNTSNGHTHLGDKVPAAVPSERRVHSVVTAHDVSLEVLLRLRAAGHDRAARFAHVPAAAANFYRPAAATSIVPLKVWFITWLNKNRSTKDGAAIATENVSVRRRGA